MVENDSVLGFHQKYQKEANGTTNKTIMKPYEAKILTITPPALSSNKQSRNLKDCQFSVIMKVLKHLYIGVYSLFKTDNVTSSNLYSAKT